MRNFSLNRKLNNMNTAKNFLAIALLLLISLPALKAQNDTKLTTAAGQRVKIPKKTPEQRAKILTDTLSSVVNLSADQYEKAYTSNVKFFIQKESVKGNKNSGLDEIKEKMKEISKTRKSEIAGILTQEQSEKWTEWKKVRKAKNVNKNGEIKTKYKNTTGELKSKYDSRLKDSASLDDIDDM